MPLTIIGTAVAFKNNQAYGRFWEARKIWGVIVHSSRVWGAYLTNQFTAKNDSEAEIENIHKRLIYRHIG